MARKTKLTPAVRRKIVDAIRAGNHANVAARLAGISESTFYRWMQRGEDETEADPRFCKFWESVKKAEAEAEDAMVKVIVKAATGGSWVAAMAYLERKFPERWRRRKEIAETPKDADDVPETEDLIDVLVTAFESQDAQAADPAEP